MKYYSITSDFYHTFKKCTVGNNIKKNNLKNGTGGKRLCKTCADMKAGIRNR